MKEQTKINGIEDEEKFHVAGKSVITPGIANFEEAISATEFGKFNFILILISIPLGFAHMCETTSMSYVLPIAQCDLNLSLEDRGLLNAITYLGMVSSGLLWGFISDTFGRKRTICIGTFLDTFLVISCSLSQSVAFLTAIKFFGGFVFAGPVAALTAYLSECHSAKYRSRIILVLGIIISCATIALPLMAGIILPLDIRFNILNYLDIHSWNIYLLSTATFPITAACCFIFVPESPKFLMTIGKNEQALEVFKNIYSWNTGKPKDTYPISSLIIEKEMRISEMDITNRKDRIKHFLRYELITIRSLFVPPLLKNTFLVCGLQMTIVLSLTTIRLWIPTILQVITDYEHHHSGQSTNLCTMLEVFQPKKVNSTGECTVNTNNSQVYVNAIIIASVCSCGYLAAGSLIKILGHKKLLIILGTTGGLSCFCFYFSTTKTFTIILMSIDTTVASIGVSVILSSAVTLFPTNLRTMAVQLTMLSGRTGGMCGNLVFPFLLKIGCVAAFGTIGTIFLTTFEEAITATKFGTFNIILLLIAIPAGWSSVFENTTMSYVFPAAECDLNLSLNKKGLLNAITYIGMMTSGFIWGYLCDAFGRRKLLVIGYFTDSLLVMTSSLSQSFTILLITKFLGGMIINGPFAALATYITEVHCAKYRPIVQMVLGTIFSIAGVILPLMATLILPSDINFTIFDSLKMHPWNVFLFFASFPPLLAGCGFFLLPESPKFLMTSGRNKEAMEVFKLIYSLNTGKPRDTYPITKLVNENSANQFESLGLLADIKQSAKEKLSGGFDRIKSLFVPPLVKDLMLACSLQMFYMMSLNTLRLWIPQLFQAISDYEYYNNGTSADLCTMLEVIKPKNVSSTEGCVVNTNNTQVYMNSMIISASSVVGSMAAGYFINILGKKRLLFIIGIVSASCAYSLYFASNTNMALIMSSLYITLTGVGFNVVLSVIVELFPTNLRTMTISLAMTVARFGSMTGNLMFPVLLKTGCAAPFFTIGSVVLSSSFLSLLLPNTEMIALK